MNRFRTLADIGPNTPYIMRLSGRFEGIMSDGDLVTSTIYAQTLNFTYDPITGGQACTEF